MSDFNVSAAAVAAAGAAGVAVTLDGAAVALFGVPLPAVVGALAGAAVPPLLLDPDPLPLALRRWLGSALFALVFAALVLYLADLPPVAALGVSAALAAFARDLFALVRGELPPLITAARQRLIPENRKGEG